MNLPQTLERRSTRASAGQSGPDAEQLAAADTTGRDSLGEALALTPYAAAPSIRGELLGAGLAHLNTWHAVRCDAYRRIIDGFWPAPQTADTELPELTQLPFLPVGLFKQVRLSSIDADRQVSTLHSSGTTSRATSQIVLDADTSMRQQRALASSMSLLLGKARVPMLIVDTPEVIRNPKLMSARGAGVLGMMRFGRDQTFLLDEAGNVSPMKLAAFLERHAGKPFFIFGFTFMVWTQLYQAFHTAGVDLSNATLVHSGGWKALEAVSVDNRTFRQRLGDAFGVHRVHNFYGMVEQLGTLYLEGDDGLLYPPNFAEVIVRDPRTWEPCPVGTPGLLQVLSLVPTSNPGHSLLTEDLGVVESMSTQGRFRGQGFRVLGRVPKAELRGCSDVIGARTVTAGR